MITSDAGFIIATPTKCATTSLEGVAKRHMRNAGIDADLFRIMDWDKPRRQHRMCLPPAMGTVGEGEEYADPDDGSSLARPNPGAEWEDAARILLIRDPFTRYASIYRYLRSPQNYSQWGARYVQGREWGGHDPVIGATLEDLDPMDFPTFLGWLADQRELLAEPDEVARRGDLSTGSAYRSPWVWTDPLDWSAAVWGVEPGNVLRLESLWGDDGDLALLFARFGVDGVDARELHANRSTGWGSDVDTTAEFWGGLGVSRIAPYMWFSRGKVRKAVARLGVFEECDRMHVLAHG